MAAGKGWGSASAASYLPLLSSRLSWHMRLLWIQPHAKRCLPFYKNQQGLPSWEEYMFVVTVCQNATSKHYFNQ